MASLPPRVGRGNNYRSPPAVHRPAGLCKDGGVVVGARGGVEAVSPAVSCLGPSYRPQAGGAAKGLTEGQGAGAGDEEDKVSKRMMEYAALHMTIVPCEFKATALARIR